MSEQDRQQLREMARALWNELERLPASEQGEPLPFLAHKLCEKVAEVAAPNQE